MAYPYGDQEKIYDKGGLYDFYKDIGAITKSAKNEVAICDAYVNEELLDLYIAKLSPGTKIRILTEKPKGNFIVVAGKFKQKPGVNFEVRTSSDCHDRLLFVDEICYAFGQSVKDAGRKPTYLVRLVSYDLLKRIFEELWKNATPLV